MTSSIHEIVESISTDYVSVANVIDWLQCLPSHTHFRIHGQSYYDPEDKVSLTLAFELFEDPKGRITTTGE